MEVDFGLAIYRTELYGGEQRTLRRYKHTYKAKIIITWKREKTGIRLLTQAKQRMQTEISMLSPRRVHSK